MDNEYYFSLAKVRIERARELLAIEQVEVTTHNGALRQFNYLYIFNGDGTFTSQDYQMIAGAEQIRNASDYDDFYVASKDEARRQVENADYLVTKIDAFLSKTTDESGKN